MKNSIKFSVVAAATIMVVVPNLALGDNDTFTITWSGSEAVISDASGNINNQTYNPYEYYSPRGNGNTVNIELGDANTYTGDIYGSYGIQALSANGNTVYMKSGTISGNLYGGFSDYGEAINNTVIFSGGKVHGIIYGGIVYDTSTAVGTGMGSGDMLSGNILKIGESLANPAPMNTLEADGIENFKEVEFYLPTSVKPNDVALYFPGQRLINLHDMTIRAFLEGDTPNLSMDSVVHLMKSKYGKIVVQDTTGASGQYNVEPSVDVNIGNLIHVQGDIGISNDETTLDLTFTGGQEKPTPTPTPKADENAKSLLETNLAHISMVNEGANLLLSNLEKIIPQDANSNYFAFALGAGLDKRLKTGSHIDLTGFNVNVGVAANDYYNSGTLTTGVFIEYGKGKYESYLDNGTKGEGDTEFIGGGVFAKFKNISNYYFEISGRVGSVTTDYEKSLYDEFDISSTYYGAHLGLGKVFELTGSNELDIFARGIYSYTQSAGTQIKGVNVEFDSITSKRAQIGFKDYIKFNEANKMYFGATYQHEFDGVANGSVSLSSLGVSADIASPKLKGSTGIGEIGYVYEDGALKFEVGAKGYTGREKGYSGNLGLTFKF
ncbi:MULTISPECIES: autotransporter outer membrane beta-barrel domain-containing protein [unclassified Campylobacter]|uniref:autotransporter outer membrane beta-barrel domain-containing protein n=1 Tax=unclassified Campylobacter TaxID=2593542 RepID=UPI0022E9B6E5|nr:MULTISPECIES: autotransporter outer membrane beta-barrel domain-containing protein [unclassified Campylobacter]MDA3061812.1 autotransporter outer membrane beta-barrel domain-containing protein [Campylobacter sp. JMF_14 EL1]MDA3073082.1 autotransporter outer membrane beta-barrel domain-containing protein [Campylobacter sp. JMF_10 EL2]